MEIEEEIVEDEIEKTSRDIYEEDFRENLLDDDEINPAEDGFMQGYEKN